MMYPTISPNWRVLVFRNRLNPLRWLPVCHRRWCNKLPIPWQLKRIAGWVMVREDQTMLLQWEVQPARIWIHWWNRIHTISRPTRQAQQAIKTCPIQHPTKIQATKIHPGDTTATITILRSKFLRQTIIHRRTLTTRITSPHISRVKLRVTNSKIQLLKTVSSLWATLHRWSTTLFRVHRTQIFRLVESKWICIWFRNEFVSYKFFFPIFSSTGNSNYLSNQYSVSQTSGYPSQQSYQTNQSVYGSGLNNTGYVEFNFCLILLFKCEITLFFPTQCFNVIYNLICWFFFSFF